MKIIIVVCLLVVAAFAVPNVEVKRGEPDNDMAVTCDTGMCRKSCRIFGWSGGKCLGGSCLCYRFKNYLQVQKISNGVDGDVPATNDICEQIECVLWCQKMGKIGGTCAMGRCVCF